MEHLNPQIDQRVIRNNFSPLDDPGNILWWNPDDPSSISHSSNQIDQINDLTGNNNHGTSSLTNRPLTNTVSTKGRNLIKFDGSNDHLSTPSIDIATNDELTIFMVLRNLGNHGGGYSNPLIICPSPTLSTNFYQCYEGHGSLPSGGVGNIGWHNSAADFSLDGGEELQNDVTKIVTLQISKSQTRSAIWVNKVQADTGSADTTLVSNPFHFGRFATNAFNGGMGEVIVNTSNITDSKVLQTISYLMGRWV